jgi:hypothetical protein
MKRFFTFHLLAVSLLLASCASVPSGESIEQWDIYELTLTGPSEGNPFLDVVLGADFTNGARTVAVTGFYDGDGSYRIRFMPDTQGKWSYVTRSDAPVLDGQSGTFTCIAPSTGNHGPVRVRNTYYLAYEDGTPYFQIGTTCYAWAHQGDTMEEQTLETLKSSPFNKLRMCVFPKDYSYNKNEPEYYPFEGTPLKDWDFDRFNPEFFRHFEQRVADLRDLGIEADIILLHPYDRWGFDEMDDEIDDRYLKYVVARLSAYRNVWWSMANEYDFMGDKSMDDWDRFFQIVRDNDPYGHLRGIHNGGRWYDHTKPWVTHASIQASTLLPGIDWREQFNKPVINDECRYEGDVPQGWGNLTAAQLVNHFWLGTISGVYVGHGETYKHPDDILWWSKGSVLHGESPERIAWLKRFMADLPPFETLIPEKLSPAVVSLKKPGELHLVYFTNTESVEIDLPGETPWKVDEIDTWNMREVPVGTAPSGKSILSPPRANYVLRLIPYRSGEHIRPEVHATADPEIGTSPLHVRFTTPSKFHTEWDFGDGESSTDANPSHVYHKHGRFSPTLTVTDDAGVSSRMPLSIAVMPEPPADILTQTTWPGSREGLVFLWERNSAANRIVDDAGAVIRTCRVEPDGEAAFDRSGAMVLSGGKFLPRDMDDALLAACRETGQLTIEAIITPDNLTQGGPARIVTFSRDSNSRNFTLGQEGKLLVMRLRTTFNSGNAMTPQFILGQLEVHTPVHVIVSYFSGNFYCYLNGEKVVSSGELLGDFTNWVPNHMLFGDEVTGGRPWKGTLGNVAIYNRFVGPDEARKKYALNGK